jgi:hypothetical protein
MYSSTTNRILKAKSTQDLSAKPQGPALPQNMTNSSISAINVNNVQDQGKKIKKTNADDRRAKKVAEVSEFDTNTRRSIAKESLLSLDRCFLDNPLQVSRYCREIFEYYLKEEVT